MEKKTIIIISIISVTISMIYLLLQYFGLLRYVGLYLFSSENYIKNYKNLDKIDQSNRTVISLTTTPEKMKKITPVISSLLDQTVRVDSIYITVPRGSQYKLPKNLKDVVTVFRTKQYKDDLSPILSTLMREGEFNTQIIVLGDSTIYGKDFIERMIDESNKEPNKIIYVNNKDYINLKKGVIFKTNFFKEDIMDSGDKVDYNEFVNNYFKNFPKKRISYTENYYKI